MKLRDAARWSIALAGTALLAGCARPDEEVVEEPVPMPSASPIEYPLALWDQRVQGETEVSIYVNVYGDVDSARVQRSSGYAEFDSAAVQGARQLRFTPGRKGDRRVAMWIRVPVRFARDSVAELGSPTSSGLRQ